MLFVQLGAYYFSNNVKCNNVQEYPKQVDTCRRHNNSERLQ